ncbi:GNAT family N-acetyltransferase [Streptomyces clavuligerus]|uniref:Acetyltransferase n=1 Tax=Streptomyces clavuligerus TaxID=1901 RepID=E2Q7W8_STRCL|nr:GNAT family protein [Streptomyces clavuligerus]ANW17936.1 GCN5 family acetyltransferase [Streptomyces clavuligerus]AXU12493.1 N-acetyltransferase [Streptomyces clavuligerus]EFG09500.1 Acetyltransferase [Streptomyces clavuligerus]MBY6302389.1 GNAT family N-acetyltransferase [Streptomyces clavuligerus]QCS05275.1 N-acetyltransferase [Streptomyces clavuligerus]
MFAIPLGSDADGTGAELRPLEPWQAEEFFAHIERGREHIGRHVPLPDVNRTVEESRAFLERYAEKQAADGGRIYGIWQGGTLVGGVLFRLFDAGQGTCEVGCWLEPAAVGQGLVTRALRLLIDWAVDVRGIHRVEWVASAENAPSLRTAERLGMRCDGVLRDGDLHRGKRTDLEIWSVLAPEWRQARASAS